MSTKRKAVALISGGLDSLLAAKLMLEQNIHVEGLNFFTGFCVEGHTHAIRNSKRDKVKRNNALWSAEQLGIKLHIIDVIEPYKQVVLNPKHGYGANLNPCLDCKSFMVGRAREWMESNEFDFVITGEVIGQRPKSQLRRNFPVVAAESGAGDRLLRPLSAQLLPETMPERAGWVDRDKLLDLSGRGRRPQIALAHKYGFHDFAQPAGGCCFLTDETYSRKMRDMWEHRGERTYELDDVMLLKVGRHLRPKLDWKIIIARDSGESSYLRGYRYRFPHLVFESHSGPVALIDGTITDDDAELAARIASRFCAAREAPQVDIRFVRKDGSEKLFSVKPMNKTEIQELWYV